MGTFTEKWGWVYYIDIVAEKVRDTWRNVQNMNIVEFLNIVSYIRDKNSFEKEQFKKYKRR